MTEAIYKVGDVLEFKNSFGFPANMDSIPGPLRALVIRVDGAYEYIVYRLLMFSKECNNFINRYVSALQKDIITGAKKIGHIDISLLRFEEKEQEGPDYAMFFTAATLAQAADLRNENKKLKAENKALSDTLSKSEADNAMLKSQITCMEGRIESLVQKRDQLDADNRYLSAKVEHLKFGNDRKNGKIGSLQANLAEETLKRKQAEAELNEKAEELDKVYHSDIVCENNKLRNENKILNEIMNDLKSSCDNCEARSENEVLKRENEELRGYNKELEQALSKLKEENGKLAQKISCADNLLAEAANRLYQGRAHLNITAH